MAFVVMNAEGTKFAATDRETVPALAPGFYKYDEMMFGIEFERTELPAGAIVAGVDPEIDAIRAQINTFWDSAGRYREIGVPHKRGVLLYGPPGAGKTTLIRQLARDTIDRGGLVLDFMQNLSEFLPALTAARKNAPETPILAFAEDIDGISEGSGADRYLLDVLDGMTAIEGVVFIMTTNKVGKLGHRMKSRPGRVDVLARVPYPSKVARASYLTSAFAALSEDDVRVLAERTEGMSLAHVKEAAIRFLLYGGFTENDAAEFRVSCQAMEKEDVDNSRHRKDRQPIQYAGVDTDN